MGQVFDSDVHLYQVTPLTVVLGEADQVSAFNHNQGSIDGDYCLGVFKVVGDKGRLHVSVVKANEVGGICNVEDFILLLVVEHRAHGESMVLKHFCGVLAVMSKSIFDNSAFGLTLVAVAPPDAVVLINVEASDLVGKSILLLVHSFGLVAGSVVQDLELYLEDLGIFGIRHVELLVLLVYC